MTDYLTVASKTVATDGSPCYLAIHPELPGCMASGDSEAEALENLDDARQLYLAVLAERGLPAPRAAGASATETFASDFSGVLALPLTPVPEVILV